MKTNDDAKKKTVRVSFRTTQEVYDLLTQRAEKERRSIASLVDFLVTESLKNDEKKIKTTP